MPDCKKDKCEGCPGHNKSEKDDCCGNEDCNCGKKKDEE